MNSFKGVEENSTEVLNILFFIRVLNFLQQSETLSRFVYSLFDCSFSAHPVKAAYFCLRSLEQNVHYCFHNNLPENLTNTIGLTFGHLSNDIILQTLNSANVSSLFSVANRYVNQAALSRRLYCSCPKVVKDRVSTHQYQDR